MPKEERNLFLIDDQDKKYILSNIDEIKQAAKNQDKDAMYYMGLYHFFNLFEEPDIYEAFDYFQKAARKDHQIAQKYLGLCYAKGIGIDSSFYQSIYWLLKAAAQDHKDGLVNLSVNFFSNYLIKAEYKKPVYWYDLALELGEAYAEFILGLCYYKGVAISKDLDQSIRHFLNASKQNVSMASFIMGHFYENGIGVEKNIKKSLHFYKKSADLNNGQAYGRLGVHYYENGSGKDAFACFTLGAKNNDINSIYYLGVCYELGVGCKIDTDKAFHFQSRAAENGHSEALYRLSYFYKNGVGTKRNKRTSYNYLVKAVKLGSNQAINALYKYKLEGYHVEKNPEKAFLFLKENLKPNNYIGHFNLSIAYALGIGTEVNETLAIQYLKKAAIGDKESMHYLGLNYLNGNLVPKDVEKGFLWLEKAIQHECLEAKVSFGHYYFENEKYLRALKWYKQAFNQGHKGVLPDLALTYFILGRKRKALYLLTRDKSKRSEAILKIVKESEKFS